MLLLLNTFQYRIYLDHNFLQLMLYPPKKRAYSPEEKKTKDLSNLPNINSKFTGSGGSIL